MKRLNFALCIAVLGLIVGFSGAAAGQSAAETTTGTSENTSEATTTAGTATGTGGNVTSVNVSQVSSSDYWTGFYGNIDSTSVLGSGSDRFFEWTLEDPTGVQVIAAPSGTDISSLSAVTDTGTAETVTGLDDATAGAERVGNTYSGQEALAGFTNNPLSVDTNSGGGTFTSYLASDGSSNPAFLAKGVNSKAGFDGSSYDYQLLAGVESDGTDRTFDFYMEINP